MRPLFLALFLACCGPAADPNRVVVPAQPAAPTGVKSVETVAGKPAEIPSLKPLESPACRITASSGRTEYAINLLVEKKRVFATVGDELTNVDVRLAAGDEGGTISLTRDGITLIGEISPREVSLEGGSKLFKDWIEVRGAPVASVDPDGTLHGLVQAPHYVDPVDDDLDYPVACADATILDTTKEPKGTRASMKLATTSPLRTTPAGAIVANVLVPNNGYATKYEDVIVLEKKGNYTRVRIGPFDEVSYAWGWVDSKIIEPAAPRLEAMGEEPEPTPTVTCDHEVPIFVHEGERTVKVGSARKGAKLPLLDRRAPEPTLDLRLVPRTGPVKYSVQAQALKEAFVTAESVATCR